MKTGIKRGSYLKAGYKKEIEQTELKHQYNIEQEEVQVKVVSGTAQIFNLVWKITKITLKTICWICLVWLAIIGLASIIYPNIRAELFKTGTVMLAEIKQFLGM